MSFEDPTLPYSRNALAPHISEETLDYHFAKHHLGYVRKLRKAIVGTELESLSLEAIVQRASGKDFNNAAQILNHSFYWNSLSPKGGGEPNGAIAQRIEESFGGFEPFKQLFSKAAASNFASGWTWLVQYTDGQLDIVSTDDAQTVITKAGVTPLLTIDVWEHAYYIDYRNARTSYIDAFWKLVNWEFANQNLA